MESQTIFDPPVRRPGIERLFDEMKRLHPHWSNARCLAEAKAQWEKDRRHETR